MEIICSKFKRDEMLCWQYLEVEERRLGIGADRCFPSLDSSGHEQLEYTLKFRFILLRVSEN